MATETKDSGAAAHVVEIPAENQNVMISVIEQHPLRQISESSGHLLLLKLWQREEHLFGLRIGRRETKLESLKQQIFQLCCYFFLFHALSLTLLFTSSDPNVCHKWWVPGVAMGATSGVFVIVVQLKLWLYWKASAQLVVQEFRHHFSSVLFWHCFWCFQVHTLWPLKCFQVQLAAAARLVKQQE